MTYKETENFYSSVHQVNAKELTQWKKQLLPLTSKQRIEWSLLNLPKQHVVTSSFGLHSVVMLHLITQISPNIPIILTDTGYLFPETYQYIELLTNKLQLNLHIYRAKESQQSQIDQYGKLWEQGQQGLDTYHFLNKIEPFERAMIDLDGKTWFSGVRQTQSSFRQSLSVINLLRQHIKVHPIIDWTESDIKRYIEKNKLPLHPLVNQGYATVGDTHSTLARASQQADNRFGTYNRECGLHSFENRNKKAASYN
ncbi:phosphoadenylyl-sulfate reductase [Thalassotalea fusca]